jgi:hypothetical protein
MAAPIETEGSALYTEACGLYPFTTPQGGKAEADRMATELDEEKTRLEAALEARLAQLREVRAVVDRLRRTFMPPSRGVGRGWFKPKKTIAKARVGPK